MLRARCIRYRRERWLTPDGPLVVAPLPGGVEGHFGPELCRFVLAQDHQGQVTVPRLVAQLQATGLAISTRHSAWPQAQAPDHGFVIIAGCIRRGGNGVTVGGAL